MTLGYVFFNFRESCPGHEKICARMIQRKHEKLENGNLNVFFHE